MNTHLAFIDESGSYVTERSTRFVIRYPYYLKACFVIAANNWKKLSDFRKELCQKYNIPILNELKWNHLWKLRKRDEKNVKISYKPKEEFLKNINFNTAQSYVKEYIASLPSYNPLIICTITPNCVFSDRVAALNLEKMHIQDIMQRIEMEMSKGDENNLAILFADEPAYQQHELDLKTAYHEWFHEGDFIDKYIHIMDSLNFHHSHQCCGVQMADFIAGAVVGFLRGFSFSKEIFVLNLFENIRKNAEKNLLGYGIIDIPKRDISRRHLEDKFRDVKLVICNPEDLCEKRNKEKT